MPDTGKTFTIFQLVWKLLSGKVQEEKRRDTYVYFIGRVDGEPAYTYSLKQAIEDGYFVPYLLEQRISNLDEDAYRGPDGRTTRRQTLSGTSACSPRQRLLRRLAGCSRDPRL